MEHSEIKKALGKPQITRLKQLGSGLRVAAVHGDRLLIDMVEPETEMDKAGRYGIVIPDDIKKANTPASSTGIILQVGDGVTGNFEEGQMVLFSKFSGINFVIDEHEGYKIIDTKEILCSLE